MEENKDLRGLDLRAEHFRTRLNLLINESNLTPSLALYILKDVVREVENLYNQSVDIQYKRFCEVVNAEDNLDENSEQNKPQKEEENLNKNLDNKSE